MVLKESFKLEVIFFRQGCFGSLRASAEGWVWVMESWMVWVGKDLEDHPLMGRDSFH